MACSGVAGVRAAGVCALVVVLVAAHLTEAGVVRSAALQDVQGKRMKIALLREFLSELDASLERLHQKKKRTCLFNAGMSQSCDYGVIAGAGDDHRYLSGGASPGRK